MPLNELVCRNVKPAEAPRKISDGGGLFLLVNPGGSKLWRMAYRINGKQKTLSFGRYPSTSLAEARKKREGAKILLGKGLDPGKPTVDPSSTFGAMCESWLATNREKWTPKYLATIMRRLETDVLPELGHLPVAEIMPTKVLETVRKVEARGVIDTSKRIRQYISGVFCFAIAEGACTLNAADNIGAALKPTPRTKHFSKLAADEIPSFFRKLRSYDGERQTALALELTFHTLLRTNEIRFGKWSEISGKLWKIPGARMKMKLDHIVPLTDRVLEILADLKKIAGDSEFIVPGSKSQPISENTMLFAMYRMGYHGRATVHGLRGTGSTILNESGLWRPDAVERQLAHVEDNKVRAAYNAAEYIQERTLMMTWWSNYLEMQADLGDLIG